MGSGHSSDGGQGAAAEAHAANAKAAAAKAAAAKAKADAAAAKAAAQAKVAAAMAKTGGAVAGMTLHACECGCCLLVFYGLYKLHLGTSEDRRARFEHDAHQKKIEADLEHARLEREIAQLAHERECEEEKHRHEIEMMQANPQLYAYQLDAKLKVEALKIWCGSGRRTRDEGLEGIASFLTDGGAYSSRSAAASSGVSAATPVD
uniref:Uncharacterized protein n=1 Tax=Alexandrium monilatum TaxID=311494 RepID=A0A7S4QQW9_9DINO